MKQVNWKVKRILGFDAVCNGRQCDADPFDYVSPPFFAIACIVVCAIYVSNVPQFVIWREEVKLNDGRVIVVEQKKRDVGDMDREAWLTIDLPEFSKQSIIWHENLRPMVINIDGGSLYVVARPPTGIEGRQYGCTTPPYIGFIWRNRMWSRIPFEGIPKSIYDTNLLIERFPPKGINYLTLEKKNGTEVNGNGLLPYNLKKMVRLGFLWVKGYANAQV